MMLLYSDTWAVIQIGIVALSIVGILISLKQMPRKVAILTSLTILVAWILIIGFLITHLDLLEVTYGIK